jgi:pimeloyl-ACP methyl ester carboxylesterase
MLANPRGFEPERAPPRILPAMKHRHAVQLSLFLLASVPSGQERLSLEQATISAGDVTYRAERGSLAVPENRHVEGSRTIQLAFGRLRSTAAEPGPPLFFLPGGPGNAAMPLARSPAWAPFLELGDVVLLDPRGVGESQPDLFFESEDVLSELFFTDRATAVEHMREVVELGVAHFEARGVDFRGYDAIETADDIDALRRALGYERINLLGHSWGTVVGQVVIRRHGEHVGRFVSVGSAGPHELMKLPSQLDRSLARLAEVVADDPVVGAEMPDLVASMRAAVETLRDEPLVVTIENPRDGRPLELPVGPFGFQLALVADLADTSDLPVIPRLIRSVEERDPTMLASFVGKRVDQFARVPLLMLCARAASGASEERWELIRSEAKTSPFGLARCMFSPEIDAAFGDIDVGDAHRTPVTSDVPVLFVSGELDAATPVEQAEAVRAGFPRSGHVIVQYAGHEDLMSDPEVREHMLAFLAGDAPADARIEREPLRFAPLTGPAPGFRHGSLRD